MGNRSKSTQGSLPTMGEDVTGTRFSAEGNTPWLSNRPSAIIEKAENGEIITDADAAIDMTELEYLKDGWEAPGQHFYGERRGVETMEMRQKRMEILDKIDDLIYDASGLYDSPTSEGYLEDYIQHLDEYSNLMSEYESIADATPYEQWDVPEVNPTIITQTPPPQQSTITATTPTNPNDIKFVRRD